MNTVNLNELPVEAKEYLANTSFAAEKYTDIWALLDQTTRTQISELKDSGSDRYETGDIQLGAIEAEYDKNPMIQKCVDELSKARDRHLVELNQARQEKIAEAKQQEQLDLEECYRELRRLDRLEAKQLAAQEEAEHDRYIQEAMARRRETSINIHNKMVEKTMSDLRDAEYFHTGQEHYLQQQMAELMAKKF
jgi:hypothetical protein